MLQPGDVLVSTANSVPLVGKAVLVRDIPEPATFGAFVTVLRPGREINPEYLNLWMQSPAYLKVARGLASQTTSIANLRVSDLMQIQLPLPELDDQRLVTNALSEQLAFVDAGRIGVEERLEAGVSLAIRAYEVAFYGAVPFSVVPLDVAPPPGWTWHSLTELARLESGHTPSRSRDDWWGGEIPWLALPDIRRLDGKVASSTTETTNADGIANSSARILPRDTVVMSRTASVGFVTRMGRPMATSQDFVNWVCGPDLDPEFLMHLLIRARGEIRALSSGAIHKTVYMPTVKAFRVCVPVIGEQRRIAAELRARRAAIDAMEASIRAEREAIEALPAALLRRVFEDLAA
jgi:type I restriction enzyme S subunit